MEGRFVLPSIMLMYGGSCMVTRKLEIAETYLNDVLKRSSIKTVGEVLTRIETISDINELKAAIKDTIYENFRDLKTEIRAFDCGVKFVRPLAR